MQFIHDSKLGKVTVPYHGNADIAKFVLANIWRQAGWK